MTMTYEEQAMKELSAWQREMKLGPSLIGELTRRIQGRINRIIPEKIHTAVTVAIKQITRAVIFGSGFTTARPVIDLSMEEREQKVRHKIKVYKNTAATEGAITGAGGILLGLADFPLWLTLKMKMLHDIAAAYGYDVKEYRERLYILYIFQLTFSTQRRRNEIFAILEKWTEAEHTLPKDINDFDWRSFQLEYRDYIDLAKLLQLIPGIGAPIGAYVNHRLTKKLGVTAMNAYRLRWKMQRMLP